MEETGGQHLERLWFDKVMRSIALLCFAACLIAPPAVSRLHLGPRGRVPFAVIIIFYDSAHA